MFVIFKYMFIVSNDFEVNKDIPLQKVYIFISFEIYLMDMQQINDKINAFANELINTIKQYIAMFRALPLDEQISWTAIAVGVIAFLTGVILW